MATPMGRLVQWRTHSPAGHHQVAWSHALEVALCQGHRRLYHEDVTERNVAGTWEQM